MTYITGGKDLLILFLLFYTYVDQFCHHSIVGNESASMWARC